MKLRYSLDLNEVIVSGDLAVVRLVWILTVTDPDNKVVETTRDRGMGIFRLKPDGTRKISRYIAYPLGGRG